MPNETLPPLVLGRRLVLLVALHHRPRTRAELYQILNDQGYGADDTRPGETVGPPPETWIYKFYSDRSDLKALGYNIEFDRKQNHYYWANSPFGLALDDAQLAALALLRQTFANQTFPRVADIRAFLDSLVARLPAEQARALYRLPPGLAIHLAEASSYETLDLHTLQAIEAALKAQRQLEFEYQSPKNMATFRHCITIESFVYKDGHVYLYGWEAGYSDLKQFRVERIVPHTARSAVTAQRGVHRNLRGVPTLDSFLRQRASPEESQWRRRLRACLI